MLNDPEKLLDEPGETEKEFRMLIRAVRKGGPKEGLELPITEDLYFKIFPECVFLIDGDEAIKMDEESAVATLYDMYFLSGGLELLMEAVQSSGQARTYDIVGRKLVITPGTEEAMVSIITDREVW